MAVQLHPVLPQALRARGCSSKTRTFRADDRPFDRYLRGIRESLSRKQPSEEGSVEAEGSALRTQRTFFHFNELTAPGTLWGRAALSG